jgi:uracil-DNA glycosylase family 4
MRQVKLFDIVASQELNQIQDPLKLINAIANSDCTRCRRSDYRKANEGQRITVYRGNPMADLWVVGKSPGMADGLEGTPYSFGSGDMLMKWIKFLGRDPQSGAFMTNPVFCAAKDDAAPTVTELRECSFYFDMLVERLKPKVFLCLGNVGWKAVDPTDHISLSEVVGNAKPIVSRFGIPAWVVYHPAFFFKGTPDVDEAKAKTTRVLHAMRASLCKTSVAK